MSADSPTASLRYEFGAVRSVLYSELRNLVSSSYSEQPKHIFNRYFRKCYLLILLMLSSDTTLPNEGGIGGWRFWYDLYLFAFV